MTSVTIPNSVETIGEGAFSSCSALTSVIIGKKVTSIGGRAFEGTGISTVFSLIEEPFAIEGKASYFRTFSEYTFMNATLYVPKGTIDKYKATEGWKDFSIIKEGIPTGVERIKAGQEGAVSYYSLGGQQLAQPRKGLVIKKTADGKSRKVMVR